ncbi:hypothetical protein ACUOG4_23015, partial [Escherichia coli]
LFGIMTIYPYLHKRRPVSGSVHGDIPNLSNLAIKKYQRIAIALDFSIKDEKLIAYALAQGEPDTRYLLIHIVESASANYLDSSSDDAETIYDKQ